MAVEIIKPPKAISQRHFKNSLKIFLAGSIEMGIADNWQERVQDHFQAETPDGVSQNYKGFDITLFNPRRDNWNSDWKQSVQQPQFYQQVNWELNALDKSDYIIMYFDPNTKSPISLMELGLYASSGKLLVCCPDGFWRKGNVEVVCEKYDILLFDELPELLNEIRTKITSYTYG